MKKNKVLFFGPYLQPVTGQSLSFQQSYEGYNGDKILVNTTTFGNSKILNSIYCFLIVPFLFLFKSFNVVYFTCTRSKFGALKDIQLLLLCNLFNKKVVNHLHGADFILFYHNSGSLKRILKYCYEQIDKSIVLLPSMAEQFAEFSSMELEVLQNCYTYEYANIDVDFNNKKRQIVYLSNIIYSKGIFVFLEAARNILKIDSDIKIKIAGLPMADSFKSEREMQNLFNDAFNKIKIDFPERIFYLGTVKGKEKIDLLLESSVFVLPTFYKIEAFPITIIEAMRFGNAIITTNHNYLEDIINHKNGKLIEIKSSEGIVNAVNDLFLDRIKLTEIQNHNINEALNKYSPTTYNENLYKILEGIIK